MKNWKVILVVFLLGGAVAVANWLGFGEVGAQIEAHIPARVSNTVVVE